MKKKALSIAIASLAITGCGEDAPDPPPLRSSAEASLLPEHSKVCASHSVTKWTGETISGAAVIASGARYLDGDVGGMTAPQTVNGVIAEGTPFVCIVYFGDEPTSDAPQVRRVACDVPDEFRFDRKARLGADKSGWNCVMTGR